MKTLTTHTVRRLAASFRQSWPMMIIVTFIFFVIEYSQNIREEPQQPLPCPPLEPEFGLVMTNEEMNQVMLKRDWPSLRGYETRDANPTTHPVDPLLLDRLQLNQRVLKRPLLRVRNKDDSVKEKHEWKFEKIIHQTWKTERIPVQTAPWVGKWLELHPDWTYVFWTDDSAWEFVSEYYPSLLPVYDSWTLPVQRADMFRIIALFAFGGVYADLDIEPLKPLDEIRDWSSCILSREPDLQTYVMVNDLNFWANNYTFTCNAFMACRSHHPFLQYVLGRITRRSPMLTGHNCPLSLTLDCTGPVMISLSYGFYRRSIPENVRQARKDYDVICPKYEYFLPTFDNTRLLQARRVCRKKTLTLTQRDICLKWKERSYTNKPLSHSFTDHKWFHSYHFNVNRNRRVDIRNITRPIIWSLDEQQKYFHVEYV